MLERGDVQGLNYMRSSFRRMAFLGKLALLCLVMVVASCSESPDPADGGFFNGLHGLNSGSYEQRIEDLKRELAAIELELSRTREQNSSLKNEAARISAEISRLERRRNL